MSRNFVALAMLALAGAVLMPDVSVAGPGGMRGGGIRVGGAIRAPFVFHHRNFHRNARTGILRTGTLRTSPRIHPPGSLVRPAPHRVVPGHARVTLDAPWSRFQRRHHRAHISGWVYPVTVISESEPAFIGTPYDPAEAIPVYAPQPAAAVQSVDTPPPAAPRLTSTRDENADACRSERVTVPASEGEREITVVRC